MKRFFSAVLAAVMICMCFGEAPYSARMSVSSENSFYKPGGVKSGDFVYQVDEDGSAVLTAYLGKASKVTVPSLIDGYKVETLIILTKHILSVRTLSAAARR